MTGMEVGHLARAGSTNSLSDMCVAFSGRQSVEFIEKHLERTIARELRADDGSSIEDRLTRYTEAARYSLSKQAFID